MNTQTIKFEQTIKAPPKEVYRAFTKATALREWLSDVASVVPRPGGRLYLAWNDGYYASGEFTVAKSREQIAFTWQGRGEPGATQVTVALAEQDGATLVTLEHSGLGTGEAWSKSQTEIKEGWQKALENLVSVMETGEDLRFTLRPMLGIYFADFDEEKARKMGVPVSEGSRLGGVVEGMGAQAAGLQPDDVIIGIAGYPIRDWNSFPPALQRHRAGEKVEVVFYRGPEKKLLSMELSRRPMPLIPPTAKALGELVESQYESIRADLDQFLSSVTEEEAATKPAPEEWSIQGNLAHLIHGERGYQNWITEMVTGEERVSDDYGDNVHAQVEATLAVYPTTRDLVQLYKQTQKETSNYITRLPDEFVAHKGSYWRVAYDLAENFRFHFDAHLKQMQAALEAARKGK